MNRIERKVQTDCNTCTTCVLGMSANYFIGIVTKCGRNENSRGWRFSQVMKVNITHDKGQGFNSFIYSRGIVQVRGNYTNHSSLTN